MSASFSAIHEIGPMRTSPGQAHAMSVTEESKRTAPATATTQRIPSPRPEPRRIRLLLAAPGVKQGRLDGAWWPRSRELAIELPALTDELDHRWGRITRIAVNPASWPVIPRKVQVTGHVVKVGCFTPELDPDTLLLLSYTAGRWDLLVIPPETSPTAADRLMTAAADPHNTLKGSLLIAAETSRDATEADTERESAWESEGGMSPATRGSRSESVAVQSGRAAARR
jgi:hypothetical protein